MPGLVGVATASAFLQILLSFSAVNGVSWEEWWTYDGISGPAFWGLINPEWSLCNKGRRQSPVNLEPEKLLFDPNLRFLHIDKHRINGLISNTGHSVIFTVENETRHHINITGGPLSYKYQFHEIHIHYGLHDQFGSEHAINGYSFPAELGDLSNPELRILTEELENIKYGGAEMPVNRLSVRGLLPDTDYYMTYDGSTTAPACYETVTWIIVNKPIYITKQQLHGLRRLMQGDARHPKAPLGNNFRPPQPLHHRAVRTNIDFDLSKYPGKTCPSMQRNMHYKAKTWTQY
ncbi:carbonic anhydrase-related protein 10 isoform X2 [Colias croceus]|uniref:carbonic anhydrase-related protein 10 isoform X2 n=1 Tax=Colias crocea TaxID=72248 RepID=UPI001E27AD5B|nr:carbonic anhydrase-related protein 10 isoform X2 [Colias croceus]